MPRRGTVVPTLQGPKTSDAQRSVEVESDVTVLVIPWGPEHQGLTYVYSRSVDRFRSACYGRPASKAFGRVCCAQEKRRSGSRAAQTYRDVSDFHEVFLDGRQFGAESRDLEGQVLDDGEGHPQRLTQIMFVMCTGPPCT